MIGAPRLAFSFPAPRFSPMAPMAATGGRTVQIPISEKGFIEKLAELIPGVRGYRDREARRETDRRLREYLARRLDEGRGALDVVRLSCVAANDLAPLDAVGRLDRTIQKISASLRYADGGYGGLFDQVKIREEELSRLYAYDERLLAEVETLAAALRSATSDLPDETAVEAMARRAAELDLRVARRKDIFDTPTV
jgi:hypothetical protein